MSIHIPTCATISHGIVLQQTLSSKHPCCYGRPSTARRQSRAAEPSESLPIQRFSTALHLVPRLRSLSALLKLSMPMRKRYKPSVTLSSNLCRTTSSTARRAEKENGSYANGRRRVTGIGRRCRSNIRPTTSRTPRTTSGSIG